MYELLDRIPKSNQRNPNLQNEWKYHTKYTIILRGNICLLSFSINNQSIFNPKCQFSTHNIHFFSTLQRLPIIFWPPATYWELGLCYKPPGNYINHYSHPWSNRGKRIRFIRSNPRRKIKMWTFVKWIINLFFNLVYSPINKTNGHLFSDWWWQ